MIQFLKKLVRNIEWPLVWRRMPYVIVSIIILWVYRWVWHNYYQECLTVHYYLFLGTAIAAGLVLVIFLYEKFIGWENTLLWCAACNKEIASGLSPVTRATLIRRGAFVLFVWIFDTVMGIILINSQLDLLTVSIIVGLLLCIPVLLMDINLVDPNQQSTMFSIVIRVLLILCISCVVGEKATQIVFKKNIVQKNMENLNKIYDKIDREYEAKILEEKAVVDVQRAYVDEATERLNEEMITGYLARSVAKKEQLDYEIAELETLRQKFEEKERTLKDEAAAEKIRAKGDFGLDDLVKGAIALHRASGESFWLGLLVWATRLALICISLMPVFLKFNPVQEYVDYIKKKTTT